MTLNHRIAANLTKAKDNDHQRQDDLLDRISAIINDWYLDLVGVSTTPAPFHLVLGLHNKHYRLLIQTYLSDLEDLAVRAYDEAVDAIIDALPVEVQVKLLEHAASPRLTESVNPPPLHPRRPPRWGLPLITNFAGLAAKEIKRLMKQVIFPPLKRAFIQTLLFQQQALNRIAPITRLITPSRLVSIMTQAQLKGLNRVQIAKQQLEPLMHGAKSDARRVARDAGSLISNEANMIAFQGLGSMLVGYQCHCVNTLSSRPWHFGKRNKVVYYINPKEGQKGLRQKPSPPYEPEDPAERPEGTPQLAFNCRCWVSPWLKA